MGGENISNCCPCCGREIDPSTSPGGLRVDLNSNVAYAGEKKIRLTGQQAEILWVLARRFPLACSNESLATAMWGGMTEQFCDGSRNQIKVRICHLRRALKGTGYAIRTNFGRGYQLEKVSP